MARETRPVRDAAGTSRNQAIVNQGGAGEANVTAPMIKAPVAWGADAAMDLTDFAGAEIQITAITGTITFTRSFNNADYVPVTARDGSFADVNPTSPGFYTLKGGGYLKWAGIGSLMIRGFN